MAPALQFWPNPDRALGKTSLLPPRAFATTLTSAGFSTAYGEHDHTPSGEPFHGFTKMELAALPSELATIPAGMAVFMETRENAIRMFDKAPAHWARNGGKEVLSLSVGALVGEYFTFQAGVFANSPTAALKSLSVTYTAAASATQLQQGNKPIPASAMTCFNLGGMDQHGLPFAKNFSVGAGDVGALWFGVDLPSFMPAGNAAVGTYDIAIDITAASTDTSSGAVLQSVLKKLSLVLDVRMPANGQPLPLHGDADVYQMRRLRWLDSTIGVDEAVTHPFTNLTAMAGVPGGPGADPSGITVGVVNKQTHIGANGLPAQTTVTAVKLRKGKNVSVSYEVLAQPVAFECLVAGKPVQMKVTQEAKLLSQSASTAKWVAQLEGGGLSLNVSGELDFDSYLEFAVTVSATTAPVELSDIVLRVQAKNSTAKMMCGMGVDGSYMHDISWTWDQSQGNNRLWMGRVEAGVYVYPKGYGPNWENPDYSQDYPTLPFIPMSWGGVGALNATKTKTGAKVTTTEGMVTSSGPRSLKPGEPVRFLFDMAFTPSKPLDLRRHWASRYLQIGYGVDYTTPAAVAAQGVTVATLHQGIGGIHNITGDATPSMVNPYINWPFVPDVVNFMEGYTKEAHALNVQVRVLSVKTVVLSVKLTGGVALAGEILLYHPGADKPRR